MGWWVRSCVQTMLKVVNSVIGMTGMAMILYALWMIRAWQRTIYGSWVLSGTDSSPPWFIYTFLGLGISLCLITCSGHIAAEAANGHCLSCVSFNKYMLFILLLVLLEAAITADVFLNPNWEEDFPQDPTGRFDEFKKFVNANFEMCKWIGFSIIGAQVLSILLSIVLRALGPDDGDYYDSDDDSDPPRLPLLRRQVQQQAPISPASPPSVKYTFWNGGNRG
ncbi:hypothetical protein IHE45_19G077800 [Dioscorea alata]|nr:hypothetical protein IHE45_19G077800 [Dioscorea alata]KAH7653390.1 hypothetical protein IHE45_19G077800 [Dioscorea alata]